MIKISRRRFLTGAIALVAGGGGYLWYERHVVQVRRYTVPVAGLPEVFRGFTILHLSDLHSKTFGPAQHDLLALIKTLRYDMVAITGDLVNNHRPDPVPAADLVKGLKDAPVYWVSGNHEFNADRRLKRLLSANGALFIDNMVIRLERDGHHIWLVGIEYPVWDLRPLDRVITLVPDAAPKILLAHAPRIFDKAAGYGIDLVLVGHTHGGQIRIPFLGSLYASGEGFFPPRDYGLFREGKTAMVVSGGLGETGPPIRINIPPEVGLVTLVPD